MPLVVLKAATRMLHFIILSGSLFFTAIEANTGMKLIFELASMYDCSSLGHVTAESTASIDNDFMPNNQIYPVLSLTGEIDLSMEMREHERVCVVSFDADALIKANFTKRQRRPVKIFVQSNLQPDIDIEKWYSQNDTDFHSAPILVVNEIATGKTNSTSVIEHRVLYVQYYLSLYVRGVPCENHLS